MSLAEDVEAAKADPTVELRRALREAQRKLEAHRATRAEYMETLYRAGRDAALAIDLAAIPKPTVDRRKGTPETAVVLLGDWQLGKRTPTYTSDIAADRIRLMARKVATLTAIQRADHPVNECHVRLLGDMVEGETIFPGQSFQIDSSLYAQHFRVAELTVEFIRSMLTLFRSVHVTAVIGNHGRIGRRGEYNLETNADRFAYRTAQLILRDEPRVTWNIPEGDGESYWYAIDRIGDVGSLTFHGYNLKGHAGFPWYGLGKKVGGWALGAIEEWHSLGVTEVDFGHWHQPTRVTLNRITARCNGSTESTNLYAQENLAAMGRPSQGLRFVHPRRGTTCEYTVYLDHD